MEIEGTSLTTPLDALRTDSWETWGAPRRDSWETRGAPSKESRGTRGAPEGTAGKGKAPQNKPKQNKPKQNKRGTRVETGRSQGGSRAGSESLATLQSVSCSKAQGLRERTLGLVSHCKAPAQTRRPTVAPPWFHYGFV